MKILITGGEGQLGKEVFVQASKHYDVLALGKKELDITDQENVRNVVTRFQPDVIIHTAAYTDVDQCETDIQKAIKVNGIGTYYVAQAALNANAKMMYISTDYVFSGKKRTPYNEYDTPDPLNMYGMSKWWGEQIVLATVKKPYIVRTSWLYGTHGKNFVKTIIQLARAQDEIHVIEDQVGSPSYARDVAYILLTLLQKKTGIYHVTNSGECSWYEFAQSILEVYGEDSNKIKPISSNEYEQLANRPFYSVLSHKFLESQVGQNLRHWKEALKCYIEHESIEL